jgi:hypothetical protein
LTGLDGGYVEQFGDGWVDLAWRAHRIDISWGSPIIPTDGAIATFAVRGRTWQIVARGGVNKGAELIDAHLGMIIEDNAYLHSVDGYHALLDHIEIASGPADWFDAASALP